MFHDQEGNLCGTVLRYDRDNGHLVPYPTENEQNHRLQIELVWQSALHLLAIYYNNNDPTKLQYLLQRKSPQLVNEIIEPIMNSNDEYTLTRIYLDDSYGSTDVDLVLSYCKQGAYHLIRLTELFLPDFETSYDYTNDNKSRLRTLSGKEEWPELDIIILKQKSPRILPLDRVPILFPYPSIAHGSCFVIGYPAFCNLEKFSSLYVFNTEQSKRMNAKEKQDYLRLIYEQIRVTMGNFSQRIVSIGVITSLTMGDDQIDTHTAPTLQGFSGGPLVKYHTFDPSLKQKNVEFFSGVHLDASQRKQCNFWLNTTKQGFALHYAKSILCEEELRPFVMKYKHYLLPFLNYHEKNLLNSELASKIGYIYQQNSSQEWSTIVPIKFTKIFINNEWHNAKLHMTFPVCDPRTGEEICQVEESTKADVDKAVKAARNAFRNDSEWRKMNAVVRADLMKKFAEYLRRDIDYLSKLETLNNGKPLEENKMDITISADCIDYYAGLVDKIMNKTSTTPTDSFLHSYNSPIGVLGQIISWNYPIMMLAFKLGPALACNTVILKPAEETPLTALYCASLLKEAGFPPGVVNILPGDGSKCGQFIVTHKGIDKVGKQVQALAAESNLKSLSLELLEKCPLIICEDADLDSAVELTHRTIFANSARSCFAGSRIFVHEKIYDRFVIKSVELATQRVVGDPFDSKTKQGPQINDEKFQKTIKYIKSGIKQGAKLECGGERFGTNGFFIPPTIFSNVIDDMDITSDKENPSNSTASTNVVSSPTRSLENKISRRWGTSEQTVGDSSSSTTNNTSPYVRCRSATGTNEPSTPATIVSVTTSLPPTTNTLDDSTSEKRRSNVPPSRDEEAEAQEINNLLSTVEENTNDNNQQEFLSNIDNDIEKANQHMCHLLAELDEKTRRIKELDLLLNQEKDHCKELETKLKVVLELQERDAHLHIRQLGQTDAELRKARRDTERVRILQQQLEFKQKQLEDVQKVLASGQTKYNEESSKSQHEIHEKWMEVKRLTRELDGSRKECENLRKQITKYANNQRLSQEQTMHKPITQHINNNSRISSEADINSSSSSLPLPYKQEERLIEQSSNSRTTSLIKMFKTEPRFIVLPRPCFYSQPFISSLVSNRFMLSNQFLILYDSSQRIINQNDFLSAKKK
ncbi:unnamed protein product [Rotaria sp. Silwood1]|nr:unnamed protein product [Rotaria sp. Silwood1]